MCTRACKHVIDIQPHSHTLRHVLEEFHIFSWLIIMGIVCEIDPRNMYGCYVMPVSQQLSSIIPFYVSINTCPNVMPLQKNIGTVLTNIKIMK